MTCQRCGEIVDQFEGCPVCDFVYVLDAQTVKGFRDVLRDVVRLRDALEEALDLVREASFGYQPDFALRKRAILQLCSEHADSTSYAVPIEKLREALDPEDAVPARSHWGE